VVLDFLSSIDVRRLVPPEEETDVGSEASKWELRERREREEGSEAEVQALGAEGGTPAVPTHPLIHATIPATTLAS